MRSTTISSHYTGILPIIIRIKSDFFSSSCTFLLKDKILITIRNFLQVGGLAEHNDLYLKLSSFLIAKLNSTTSFYELYQNKVDECILESFRALKIDEMSLCTMGHNLHVCSMDYNHKTWHGATMKQYT